MGDPPPGRDLHVPQLGLSAAPPDLLRVPDREKRMSAHMETGDIRIESFLSETDERSLANDVLDGLTRPFQEIPAKHFYDARGSELFEQICELPEYYPTRAERAILLARADGILCRAGAGGLLLHELDELSVHGVIGDFERHLSHVPDQDGTPRIVALLGGTIGNFLP